MFYQRAMQRARFDTNPTIQSSIVTETPIDFTWKGDIIEFICPGSTNAYSHVKTKSHKSITAAIIEAHC
jgi:hypothetical protein